MRREFTKIFFRKFFLTRENPEDIAKSMHYFQQVNICSKSNKKTLNKVYKRCSNVLKLTLSMYFFNRCEMFVVFAILQRVLINVFINNFEVMLVDSPYPWRPKSVLYQCRHYKCFLGRCNNLFMIDF